MSVPFRADHVGSLLRPTEVLEARASFAADDPRLREVEDRNILRVLGRQKELGLEIFTDGELRRRTFMSDLTDAVEGFDLNASVARSWQSEPATKEKEKDAGASNIPLGIVTGKLRARRPLTGHELPFMKQNSPGAIKMT